MPGQIPLVLPPTGDEPIACHGCGEELPLQEASETFEPCRICAWSGHPRHLDDLGCCCETCREQYQQDTESSLPF